MADHDCPFCAVGPERIAFEWSSGWGIWDGFPVSPGHLLIVPQRHAATWDDLTDSEKAGAWAAVDRAILEIRQKYSPDGFNVGFNFGQAAGQTVFHFHLHVIPRYSGDVSDPRGGVRTVIPAKGNYLKSSELEAREQQLLVKGGEDHFLPHLVVHMDKADTCDIAVAFLMDSGARLIIEHLRDFLARGGRARILIGDYLNVTDPIALRRLLDLGEKLELRIYETRSTPYHLKSYIFMSGPEGVAFVGSSNLSASALTTSIEWNYKIISSHEVSGFKQIRDGFESIYADYASRPVTPAWIDAYEKRRIITGFQESGTAPELPQPKPNPHIIQHEALAALEETRRNGFTAGLVVLATGLGKTWLAAFDSDRPHEFRRILFIAHREEILNQAVGTFRQVKPNSRIGRLSAEQREIDAELLIASVQTLGRSNHLSQFKPTDFDYIVIDEFHHAAANTYRRIIDYFQPKFLLGLTATPDRTDGADLLGLCQENLVYQADIPKGIESGRLCPFHYFGIPDNVDYSNIPWRSSNFDIEALTASIATEARAFNALEQFRKHGGQRCIGFCCSQRHADFMAAFFLKEGVKAVAVHSGAKSAPRATSLEKLSAGALEVVFAVDMFNEGVDVPSIDTVLMLRPTESAVIWLQQMGRGLRATADKKWLTVIDYIGNHRTFLTKLRSIGLIAGWETEGGGQQRELLEAIERDQLTLPPGCELTYELAAVNILKDLLKPTRTQDLFDSFYDDFYERHGQRPTAIETFHAGFNPHKNGDHSWLAFVERKKGLGAVEAAAFKSARDFFESLETTPTVRSYKILLLLSMFDGDVPELSISIDKLTDRVSSLARRIHKLSGDFSSDVEDKVALKSLLIKQPIQAFVKGEGMDNVSYFTFDGETFRLRFAVDNSTAFAGLLREILDWRLAQYLSRGSTEWSGTMVCRVARARDDTPILLLPNSAEGGRLPEGSLDVEVDNRKMQAVISKTVINAVMRLEEGINELPFILRGWFGDEVGSPGRGDRVRLRRKDDKIVMEPLGETLSATGLKPWERYLRELIPAAFNLEFNKAIWNVGFVVREPNVFLLVSLEKTGSNPDHQYVDHFISDAEFSWQSQNRTKQTSRHGQLIRDHAALGIHVHLLVRPLRRGPFVYCGQVDFVSWKGDAPIEVRWRLRQPVPKTLWSTLMVPS
jgi:superfamily II DNA or RNA helicase/diadenosine tetraphosphate (Ap4A) HIT family hydrolase